MLVEKSYKNFPDTKNLQIVKHCTVSAFSVNSLSVSYTGPIIPNITFTLLSPGCRGRPAGGGDLAACGPECGPGGVRRAQHDVVLQRLLRADRRRRHHHDRGLPGLLRSHQGEQVHADDGA